MTPRSSVASDREGARQAVRILRAQATRYAVVGTLIAVVAVVLATLLVCLFVYGGVTLDNIIRAHRENIAIWALDAMPFLFAWWGQYASMKLARAGGSLVASRTGALRQELDEARYTAQAKTDFFARMSHELRTPLNAIIGMSELLLEAEEPERRREHARVIHDSAHGLLTLINDVLDFSRIEAGRMELDEVAFDLHEHLNAVAALMAQQARAKGIRLVSLVPPQAPRHVVGDPGRLRQVVLNLVGNAIKFTDEGEVVLSLSDWEELAEGGYRVRVEVADTGAGIAPEDQAVLFGAYSQGRRRHDRGGTGLGLSITRELVQAMGGNIDFDSTPGEGSVFRFTVRLDAALPPARNETAAEVELHDCRLLLVEPDEAAREDLAGQLRALGIEVTAVDDGVEAMQLALRAAADGAPFDLLLTDMFAPHLSGEELGRRLKERPETRELCLAIMTTAGARGDAKRVNEAGFAAYLTRPIPPQHLGDLLRATLATRGLDETERRRQGLVTRYTVGAGAPGRERTVLVVDDNVFNREIALSHLARLGLPGEAVASGEEALRLVAGRDFGAVLLDLQLSDLDGDEVLERIRRLDGPRGRVPVLVLTAGATEEQARRCREAGAAEILTKPIEREHLRAALARLQVIAGAAASADAGAREPTAGDAGAQGPAAANTGAVEPEVEEATLDPALARVFLREGDARIDGMRAALDGEEVDLEALARHAHALQGASRHLPGKRLPESAARLEQLAQEGDIEAAGRQLEKLESQWRALRSVLRHTLDPGGR